MIFYIEIIKSDTDERRLDSNTEDSNREYFIGTPLHCHEQFSGFQIWFRTDY